jgi:murein DD-endopeptidase MepM/ murein hydrolase activator NlpD
MSGKRTAIGLSWVLTILLLSGGSGARAATAADRVDAGTGYGLPLSGAAPVLRGFELPPTPYAAGHRGVDLGSSEHATVLAAEAGVVTFAGSVAGRGLVVISHPDGVSTEYEPAAPIVHPGQLVARGDPIATVAGEHAGCPPDACLHWGARRDGDYFDPMTLLRPLGRVHLVAWT